MAINLPHVVASRLTPPAVERLAAAIAVDPSLAPSLVNAALPTVLAVFAGAAATPSGAQRLAEEIGARGGRALEDLDATVPDSAPGSGERLLSSHLGDAGLSRIAVVLSRLTGARTDQAQATLDRLTIVALRALAGQDPAIWRSGQALADFFAGQREAIRQAMPAGLASVLAGLGLPGISKVAASTGPVDDRRGVNSPAPRRATAPLGEQEVERAPRAATAPPEGATPRWLWPAAALVVVAGLAWWLLLGASPAPAQPAPAGASPAQTQQATPATAADIGADVAALQQALAGVTDAATARAAEPALKATASQVDRTLAAIMALPESERKAIAAQAKPSVDKLHEQVTKVLGIPEVTEVLKTILDPVMSKLVAMTGG